MGDFDPADPYKKPWGIQVVSVPLLDFMSTAGPPAFPPGTEVLDVMVETDPVNSFFIENHQTRRVLLFKVRHRYAFRSYGAPITIENWRDFAARVESCRQSYEVAI